MKITYEYLLATGFEGDCFSINAFPEKLRSKVLYKLGVLQKRGFVCQSHLNDFYIVPTTKGDALILAIKKRLFA